MSQPRRPDDDEVHRRLELGRQSYSRRALTDAQRAVENLDVKSLELLLAAGADPNERDPADGMSLLHLAIDAERDTAAQTGEPLTVDVTAALLTAGADWSVEWNGQSSLELAEELNHWLAIALIEREAERRRHG